MIKKSVIEFCEMLEHGEEFKITELQRYVFHHTAFRPSMRVCQKALRNHGLLYGAKYERVNNDKAHYRKII